MRPLRMLTRPTDFRFDRVGRLSSCRSLASPRSARRGSSEGEGIIREIPTLGNWLLLCYFLHHRSHFQPKRRSVLFLIYHRIPQMRPALYANKRLRIRLRHDADHPVEVHTFQESNAVLLVQTHPCPAFLITNLKQSRRPTACLILSNFVFVGFALIRRRMLISPSSP